MDFRIAETFTDSLGRLTGDEQKAAKMAAFDLQINPATPGFSFHKLGKAKDKNFWSVRVSSNIRMIVHRGEGSLLLCYVDHHDRAYAWAERRKLEAHPKTGAAQIVEIRETVKEIVVPVYVEETRKVAKKPILHDRSEEELLSFGVPQEWIQDVKNADEDTLLVLTDHLPKEAAEALLELATGGTPQVRPAIEADPFLHPDAQRRFRIMANVEELQQALEFPWEKWTVFLHPDQRQLVERNYTGPARVTGSAGTGKTIVALHRAVHLAKTHPEARILLGTFSDPLASSLQIKLRRLIGSAPRLGERIDVHALDSLGNRLLKSHGKGQSVVTDDEVNRRIAEAAALVEGHKFSIHFLESEWEHVVDPWQLRSWDDYRDVVRLGRKTRLPEKQRRVLWDIYGKVLEGLKGDNLLTMSGVFDFLAGKLSKQKTHPFDFAVIDEAQDISVAQLRFLVAIGGKDPNALFFAGDQGQRIFRQPFSWKSVGADIRGRSRTLKVNYRTSHQIRKQADRLLEKTITDIDGEIQDRSDTISVFNGVPPRIEYADDQDKETSLVASWIKERVEEGVLPHEIAVFVRSHSEIERAKKAVALANLPFTVLDESVQTSSGKASIATMHLAKGLEFRSVVVMACDDTVLPMSERIASAGDGGDLQEILDTERQLLYVACTRSRDHLLVTGVEPASEFLDDLGLRGS
jgi:hypothetical protein